MALRDDMRMPLRTATNLTLPPDLVAQVDEIAGPRGRSRFVEEAVRRELRRERLREALERTAGVLKAEDYPEWATSEKVVEWVRAQRAQETDPGDDSR